MKLERIAILENVIEAQRLEAVLTERNIPHLVKTYHDSAYDGLFQFGRGWGHVEAAAEHKEEVIAMLEALRQAPSDSAQQTEGAPPPSA